MDRMNDSNTLGKTIQEPAEMTKKIGRTTYKVTVHFSQTSTETIADKIKRLIQNDASCSM